eukprot:scaffold12308_cov74-Cyclotella_meneghiniana.AAC.10
MAKNDEYVQSDGLNIRKKNNDQDAAKIFVGKTSSVTENLSDRFVDAISTAAKPKNREAIKPKNRGGIPKTNSLNNGRDVVSGKVVLSDHKFSTSVLSFDNQETSSAISSRQKSNTRQIQKSNGTIYARKTSSEATGIIVGNQHAHILHQLHYESDDDSSGDDSMGDLELARNNSLSDALEHELNMTLQHQSQYEEKKRDPNRFMTITEERECLLPSHSTSSNNAILKAEFNTHTSNQFTAGMETRNALKAGLSWVKNVATPQLQAMTQNIVTKVAENDSKLFPTNTNKPMIGPRQNKLDTTNHDEDEITMTSSAAFLADTDMAELERIKSKHSSSQITLLLNNCVENPRLAFVAATLVFALFVYYYSRKKSVDDVL